MRSNIGNQVMAMAEKNSMFSGKPLTSMIVLLQNILSDTHAPMFGSLKFKIESFEKTLEKASDHGEHLKEITFSRMRANNLFRTLAMKHYNSSDHVPMPDVRKVEVTLGIEGEGEYTQSTLNGTHLVNPQWTSQQVLFKLSDGTVLPTPLPVTLKVIDQHGEVIGSAVATLSEPFGLCEVALEAPSKTDYKAVANQQPMTMSFLYRVGQWTGPPIVPPELKTAVSTTSNYTKLLKSCSLVVDDEDAEPVS